MTASSTSLAGSRRTTRRSRPSSPRTTNGKPPRRAACRRAPHARARVVRPASTPLGDGGRTRRTNPRRRTHARAIRRLRGRRSVQSLRRRRRGDGGRGTFAVRGGAAAERFRAAGSPGRRRVSFQRAARGNRRGNWRRRRRSRRRSSSRRLAISPRVHVPVTRGVHAREGYPRGSRVVRLLRASRGTRSRAGAIAPRVRSHPRRRRRRHASNGEVREPRQPRTRARVGGSGVGSRGHHNHREGSSARGGSKPRVPARESPRGDDSRERFGKGRERREPRRRREIRRRRGKKRSRIFVRGGVGGSRAFARRDGAPRERRFRRIHDGKRRRGDGVGGCRSPRAPTLRGRFRRKTPRTETPGGSVSTRAPRKRPRRDFADDTAEKRERRSSDPCRARARTPPAGGVFATGSGKPVAVS